MHHRDLHVLTHSSPTRRSSDLFDLSKRKKTIGCRTALDQSLVLAGSEHIVGTAQHTGCRAANLYMIATHRRQIIHGVEGRDFISRSEEHTSELQSLLRISYAVFCLKKHTVQLTDKNELQ